jgi:hypothetical protein
MGINVLIAHPNHPPSARTNVPKQTFSPLKENPQKSSRISVIHSHNETVGINCNADWTASTEIA